MSNIIQALWIGDRLSTMEQLCAASFIANGHEFHLYTYDELANVPNGVTLKDANSIIPRSNLFSYHKGSFAGFADWFRWELLHSRGGYWVDMDIICFKHFNFSEDIVFGIQHSHNPAVGVLRFPAGHEFTKHMIERCMNPNTLYPYDETRTKFHKLIRKYALGNRRDNIYWGEAGGPIGFTKALSHFGLSKIGKPYTFFYPVHHTHWQAIFDETLGADTELFKDTYAIHLWNELIRASGTDKDSKFPDYSLIEHLKRKYL